VIKPSGIWGVPIGELRVEVPKGIRVKGAGVELIPCEVQEVRRMEVKVKSRNGKRQRRMRRL